MKKGFWIGVLICLLPAVSWAQECETNEDCGENEVCLEICPLCESEDGSEDECPPCTSECTVLEDPGGSVEEVNSCEGDADCPVGMTCQEAYDPCAPVPVDVDDCACAECAPGEDCPPCDCGEEDLMEDPPGEDEPCEEEAIKICAPAECEPEVTDCGENFSCQPVVEICESEPGVSGGSTGSEPVGEEEKEPSVDDETGSDDTDEGDDQPTDEDTTEEVTEEGEDDSACEVLASACVPDEIECATDEDCPEEWSCELDFGGTVSIGAACACPECPEGEECPECECDEDDVTVEEVVETTGMCLPDGWDMSDGKDVLPEGEEEGEPSTSNPTEEPSEEEEESGELSAEEAGGEEEPAEEEEGDEAAAEGDEAAAEGEEAAAEGEEAAEEDDEAPADEAAAEASSEDDGCSTSGTNAPFAWGLLLMGMALVGMRRRTDLN